LAHGKTPISKRSSEPISVGRLMAARRSVRGAKKRADREAEAAAHMAVDEVKRALGERGPA
jgi:hypothetical protein